MEFFFPLQAKPIDIFCNFLSLSQSESCKEQFEFDYLRNLPAIWNDLQWSLVNTKGKG